MKSEDRQPDPEADTFAATLKAAGVKNSAQYVEGSSSVTVRQEGRDTEVFPSRNLGARQGLSLLKVLTDEKQGGVVLAPDEFREYFGNHAMDVLELLEHAV